MPRVCLELYMLKITNSTKESAKRKYNHNYYGFVSLPFCRLFLRAWGSRQLCFRFKDSGMEEEMETNNIGERLRLLRTRNNLSQEELARKLHLGSRSAISELETENRQLSPNMIRKYSEIFDVSADWIIFGQEERERTKQKTETDEILKAFFAIRKASVRRVALEQVRALAKL